ncbi:MAG: phosphotransferase [Proteobacteria bacterium]|nr:phosphotransferase [Pseudomonadota bacterium]MBS0573243.1 phosphotransferase [Pseudomonadota bacterium]
MAEGRDADIAAFIAAAGWSGAAIRPLAGDASARRYFRLARGPESAVLMDADPARGEAVGPFLAVGDWLAARGYSAPRVLARDPARGLLLLEDLGDALFARIVAGEPRREADLYRAATDFLADLHRHRPPPFLKAGDGPALAELVAILPDWYLAGMDAPVTDAALALPGLIADLHAGLVGAPPVAALRDFHAENLIWLPDRQGVARIGLLDFQDAFAADPAYDLVSLLQDARREVSAGIQAACLRAYVAARGLDERRFLPAYALMGAQRALRILAVFARLCMAGAKPQYLDHAPRVWASLQRNLAHPALARLARAVADGVPAPTPERLERIKAKCGRHQAR